MKIDIEKIKKQLSEYARGVAGGLIFGLPMLFTQEVWYQGFIIPAWRLGLFLIFQYLLLLGYVYFAGFREERHFPGVAFEAVEALGLAFIVSAFVLFVMGRFAPGMSLEEILGRIILETIPVSIGVAVASAQLGEEREEDKKKKREQAAPGTLGQYVIAAGGAVFFAVNFAATEEITIIGVEVNWWHAILIIILSLVVTYGTVFYADFKGIAKRRDVDRILETPIGETAAAYALSLVISVAILFLVGRVSIDDSLIGIAYQVIVLGFPASLGAAAGRLLI